MIFAAPRRQRAVEQAIDGAIYRGAFTLNLIAGLKGSALDEKGVVTGKSLFDWLRISQFSRLNKENAEDPIVAKEPQSGALDDGVMLSRNVQRPQYEVTLHPPGRAPTTIRLWFGRSATPTDVALPAAGVKLSFEPGLYLAEGANLRHGFLVTGTLELALSDAGPPVLTAPGQYPLRVVPDQIGNWLALFDANFRFVGETNSLAEGMELPRGLYLLRQYSGEQIGKKVLMLDGRGVGAFATEALLPSPPQIVSAAPLPQTRATHEYHQEPARADKPDIAIGEGAQILVMTRYHSRGDVAPSRRPWQGVTLSDLKGNVIVDLSQHGRRSDAMERGRSVSHKFRPDLMSCNIC
ncbi:MAG TPA: hypothetical protein VN715_09455 [Roseiarcus sp.]|nr:hypothetical protein [Roseiarcus sp.]